MSNALMTAVPVFDGINWAKWSEPMISYLMPQGQFKFLYTEEPEVDTLEDDSLNATTVSKQEDRLEAWMKETRKR